VVIPAYKRIRKHFAKVDKWSMLSRYKFARTRMVRLYEPNAKAEYLIDTFAHEQMKEWGLTAYTGRLYFNWIRGIWKLTFVFRAPYLERKIAEARQIFVRAVAYNLWLDEAPVLGAFRPEEILAKTIEELYTLVDRSGMFLQPLKELVERSENFIRFLSVAYAFNIPPARIKLEIEKIKRIEKAKYLVKIEVLESA